MRRHLPVYLGSLLLAGVAWRLADASRLLWRSGDHFTAIYLGVSLIWTWLIVALLASIIGDVWDEQAQKKRVGIQPPVRAPGYATTATPPEADDEDDEWLDPHALSQAAQALLAQQSKEARGKEPTT